MKRRTMVMTMAALAAHRPVLAQTMPLPKSNVVFGKSVDAVPMAEWEIVAQGRAEQTGARILIAAGAADLEKVPKNAVRYESKAFTFPTGQIRVLSFRKDAGGVLHQITLETALYVLRGSATAGVLGKTVELSAGDAVSLPSGVLRSKPNAAEDTVVLAYTVGHDAKNPKAAVVRGKDVKAEDMKADAGAAKVAVRRYNFDGNSIRVAELKKPGKTTSRTPATDVLIYLTSGRLKITIGDEVQEVTAGDALREEAGKPTFLEVLENSSFVVTSAPSVITPKK